jgi:hypothetical protein
MIERGGRKMTKVLGSGLNFVKIEDDEGIVYTFMCGEDGVKKDKVVESVRKKVVELIDDFDFIVYIELFEAGWKLTEVKKPDDEEEEDDDWDEEW